MKNPSLLPYISHVFAAQVLVASIFLSRYSCNLSLRVPATFRSRKRPCEVQEYLRERVSFKVYVGQVRGVAATGDTHTHTHGVLYMHVSLPLLSYICECRAFSPPIFLHRRTLSLLRLALCFHEKSMGSCIGGTRLTMRED